MQAGIGHSVRRKEDARLLTGLGRYSDDFNLPGQAYGAVVRSLHAHARIGAINTKAARAMPRVLAVLTGADAAADGLTRIPHLTAPGTPPDLVLHNRDGSAVCVAPHDVLSTDRVRHVGAAVTFVIAETPAAAKDAAERVVVEYELLPALTDALAAVEPAAARPYDDLPNIMIDAEVGDAKATAERCCWTAWSPAKA
jgi:carbon-monoxide dehydrogenase large subunit